MLGPKVAIFPCCLTDDRALFVRVPNSHFIQGLLLENLYGICELCSLMLPWLQFRIMCEQSIGMVLHLFITALFLYDNFIFNMAKEV
jgi:hypothetical protein